MKIIAALTVPALTLGVSLLAMPPASAHTPVVSADCSGVHVSGTDYDPAMQNRWSVTIDGVTQSGTFGASFDQTFPVPQDGATTSWSAFVEAEDGSYHGEGSGAVGPCGTPPGDACPDLPGSQPAGTPCTPQPDVERTEQQALDGCHVRFQGTAYGAGDLTYDEEYTDTYVFNDQANTWDLVTDTTATVTNVQFTPWSVRQQADHGCTKVPTQPPAQHASTSSTRLDCGDHVQITTTVTITTPYVYDAQTNTWKPGKPVRHTTRSEHPVHPGECGDLEVAPAQAQASQVPTVIDAGLSRAPAAVSALTPSAAPSAAPSRRPQDSQAPVLLLVSGAVLLLSAGALRERRR